MKIIENFPLKELNTFGINVVAKNYTEVTNLEDLQNLIDSKQLANENTFILGGGSNILLCSDLDALVVKNNIKFIEITNKTADDITVKVGAGENWHNFVMYALKQNWFGIENLSFIPGTIGAAPIQNIGAYGVEFKDVFHSLEAIDRESGEIELFTNEACEFGYRESIFKNKFKNRYFIYSITLKLSLHAKVKTEYGQIQETLQALNITHPTPQEVSNAVINIRKSKLPNPEEIGNSGSFFKNPEISLIHFNTLKKEFPNLPGYPISDTTIKVPAGWLIEQTGWKGYKSGDIGVHKNQALVLVNYGQGKGKDLYDLALKIKASVKNTFNIDIHPEVNIIGY